MKDTWIGTKARAEPRSIGRALMFKILGFIEECLIACNTPQGSEWALRPVRVEQDREVLRR